MDLLTARRIDVDDPDLDVYERQVIWRYLRPNPSSSYTPFDMSDELDLRYRFILEREDIDTRAEVWGQDRLAPGTTKHTPVDRTSELVQWYPRVVLGVNTDGTLDPNYAYRHIATTYNMDRVIAPGPLDANEPLGVRKMVCVNYERVPSE